jgi:hypothetical protein
VAGVNPRPTKMTVASAYVTPSCFGGPTPVRAENSLRATQATPGKSFD